MKQYDAVIIGFGKAGKTLAAELAAHDWSVAMVERSDKMYGGTCINIGCIPTKALIHSAGLAAAGASAYLRAAAGLLQGVRLLENGAGRPVAGQELP